MPSLTGLNIFILQLLDIVPEDSHINAVMRLIYAAAINKQHLHLQNVDEIHNCHVRVFYRELFTKLVCRVPGSLGFRKIIKGKPSQILCQSRSYLTYNNTDNCENTIMLIYSQRYLNLLQTL